MSVPAEDILRFMSEQKNPKFEAHDKANFFVHYRLKFDGLKGKRKLKGIFSEMHCQEIKTRNIVPNKL